MSKAGVKTPNGSSKVNAPFLGTIGKSSNFDWYNFVNPYMWYRQMEEKYGKPIEFIAPRPNITYIFIDKEKYFESDKILLEKYKWKLKKGDDDPLYRFPRASSGVRIHGKF